MRAFVLIAWVQALCFMAQVLVVDLMGKPYDIYLALSEYGMRNGHVWEVVTSLFLHTGPVHFAINLVLIVVLGRAVESRLGSKETLKLYVVAGLIGSLVQAVGALSCAIIPPDSGMITALIVDRLTGPVVASSAGIFAWLAAFCYLPWRQRASPSAVERLAKPGLIWIVFGLVALWLAATRAPQLAHLAHLGAIGWGLRWAKRQLANEVDAAAITVEERLEQADPGAN